MLEANWKMGLRLMYDSFSRGDAFQATYTAVAAGRSEVQPSTDRDGT